MTTSGRFTGKDNGSTDEVPTLAVGYREKQCGRCGIG
jgi:hypothetical protein